MRKLIAAGGLAVALVCSATGPQRILFARVFPNPGQIVLCIAQSDGGDEHPLLAIRDVDYDATWAPDGRSIVFTSERAGPADLFRVRPDGTGLERLTDDPAYDDQASVSPDGGHLVFVSSREGGIAHLWILDLATRSAHSLTAGAMPDFRPSWSPDGAWIAFASERDTTNPFAKGRWERLQFAAIWIIHPDGTGLRRVSEQGGFVGSPKWSADSRRLVAYAMTGDQTLAVRRAKTDPGTNTRLVSYDVGTDAVTEVAAPPGVKFNPSYVGNAIGYIRKDHEGSGAGIYYTDGRTGPKGDILSAAWSPDGKRVVFHRRLEGESPTWVKTFSMQPGYELIRTSILPSFSPSGDRFVMTGRPTSGILGSSIVIAASGGSQLKVIYRDDKTNVLAPQWSPSGDAIMFGIGSFDAFFNGFHSTFLKPGDRTNGGAQVAIIRPDGTGFHEVTSGPANNAFPSMAPDGKRFVYRTFGPDGDGLRIEDIATKAVSHLTEGYDNFPLWSPRGDLIVFSRQAEGAYEIFTIRPDGTGLKRLTFNRGNDAHMAWSPDGEFIAFASSRMGFKNECIYCDTPQAYGQLFVMRFDGTQVTQITDNQWEDGTPAWQPVGH